MRKVLLSLVIILTLSVATCFAAPFNTLEPGQTAIGLTYWGSADDQYVTITGEDYTVGGGYLEHRFEKVVIGFETLGRSDTVTAWPDEANEETTITDLYLHYYLNDKTRLLLGKKSFKNEYSDTYGYSGEFSDSNVYVGAAFFAPLSDNAEGYFALTTQDIQFGANFNFSKSFTGNLFYRTSSYSDQGIDLDLSGLGFGLGLKF
jgi:hypothetical protein